MKTFTRLLVFAGSAVLAADAAAQDPLNEARRHYAAAAYEEALSVLAGADRSSRRQIVEVEEYRAFCFIALGKMNEAQTAIAALVEADPLYVPSASPRILSFVSEVRRNTLPAVARRLFEAGRTAFTQKQFDRARETFQLLQRVLADPEMEGRAETADMRLLSEGFVALVNASLEPAAAPEPESTSAAPPPAAPPAPPVWLPAVAVSEVLPQWVPDSLNARLEFTGRVRLTIGTDGKVKSATIIDPSHPAYDVRLLEAARSWVYKPATRNGQPVEFEKVLEIRLRPAVNRE